MIVKFSLTLGACSDLQLHHQNFFQTWVLYQKLVIKEGFICEVPYMYIICVVQEKSMKNPLENKKTWSPLFITNKTICNIYNI